MLLGSVFGNKEKEGDLGEIEHFFLERKVLNKKNSL